MRGLAPHRESGFTVIEAMVAMAILAIAVLLSIQPLLAASNQIDDSRAISVAENLAQAEIEAIRALDYDDVGIPGYTPDGVIPAARDVDVEGWHYLVEVTVRYAGSVTGLDVIPQGGDGVEGSWDPGVDYKVVEVSVSSTGRDTAPVMMQTIVAPPNVGAHEGIANARVALSRHEPFAASNYLLPELQVRAAPAAAIRSGAQADVQVFPAIPPDDYVIEMASGGDGWIVHPEDVVDGLDQITVTAGNLTETALRVYRPARLLLTVTDSYTGEEIPDARLTLIHNPSGAQADYDPGEYVVDGLIPDAYDLRVQHADYLTWDRLSVNVPEDYPVADHAVAVVLEPKVPPTTTTTTIAPTTTTTDPGASTTTTSSTTTTTMPQSQVVTVTVTVEDNTGRPVHGATVAVDVPGEGTLTVITNEWGRALFDLEEGVVHAVTASTDWGHGPASAGFDPADETEVTLRLGRPGGTGTYVLKNGWNAEFAFRYYYYSWNLMPSNGNGEASFVGPAGWYYVGKRCLANGHTTGFTWVWLSAGQNRSVTIGGWCP